jgi:hypothetical protein
VDLIEAENLKAWTSTLLIADDDYVRRSRLSDLCRVQHRKSNPSARYALHGLAQHLAAAPVFLAAIIVQTSAI